MSQFQQLDQLMERQDGMLRTGQALAAGISKPVFYQFVQSRGLEQAAHGIYLSKDAWVDAMYLLHLRCPQAVFSHETALFFHDLTDREPLAYSITVKTGYNPTRLKSEGVQVFTIKAELYEVGLSTAQTPFGHDVPVYDMERTICDVLRSRSHIEMQTFQDALKAYARRKDKDLRTLVRYARLFRVEKILRQYLEVLLCLASLAQVNGKEYILVTAKANGTHQTEQFHILDAINVYSQIGEAGQNTYE